MAQAAVARRVAFEVLLGTVEGGYASELLMSRSAKLESRDAGLAAEITLGTLRRQGQIDRLIERYARRPVSRMDKEVAAAIRMAVYQVRFLDRVPAYAAVNDSLELLRGARKASAVGFANAVLRRASEDKTAVSPEGAVPDWMMRKWTEDFGLPAAKGAAEASLATPRMYQHVPAGEAAPDGARRTDVEGCWEVETPDPRYRIQDIGSQAIVPLLGLKAGDSFLDVCAAPGNKTAQALETTRDAVACDVSYSRLRSTRDLGIPRVAMDAAGGWALARKFDRILVDAPCSGTGTLAHNPEIKWRLGREELSRFGERQAAILRNALSALAAGGVLVYATCSLEPEENEEVARSVAGGRIEREVRRMPGRDEGDGFYAAVIR